MTRKHPVDVKKIADVYRRAKAAADPNLLGVAESLMMHAMEAEAAHARMVVAEAMLGEALDLTVGSEGNTE
jgi:hypothetical protein